MAQFPIDGPPPSEQTAPRLKPQQMNGIKDSSADENPGVNNLLEIIRQAADDLRERYTLQRTLPSGPMLWPGEVVWLESVAEDGTQTSAIREQARWLLDNSTRAERMNRGVPK